jgi:exodeoxyribonuclease-1
MSKTFFFYDLETSGFNPREQRIMQFAGQRTDMHLNKIGKPFNIIIKLTDDVLPDPDAIMVTKITPQQTQESGISEKEFLSIFHSQIAKQGTIFVGYNTVRFDDEFIRYLHYRNFYDAYEWHWKDDKSRWDLLDLVRMTRALRPGGINWPVDTEGKSVNKLELLSEANKLNHKNAHDALSDVIATIELAKLIKSKQPMLFEYLLKMRKKDNVKKIVESGVPFVYCSGKYPSETEKTTIALFITNNDKSGALVYDLRQNPSDLIKMSPEQLAKKWLNKTEISEKPFPIKGLQYNRCPAVASTKVLNEETLRRLKLNKKNIEINNDLIKNNNKFKNNVNKALKIINEERVKKQLNEQKDVDACLYDGFFGDADKQKMKIIHDADAQKLADLKIKFDDDRLNKMLFLYKSRNFNNQLSSEELQKWEEYKQNKFLNKRENRLVKYFESLNEIAGNKTTKQDKFIIEELKLYAENIVPSLYDN